MSLSQPPRKADLSVLLSSASDFEQLCRTLVRVRIEALSTRQVLAPRFMNAPEFSALLSRFPVESSLCNVPLHDSWPMIASVVLCDVVVNWRPRMTLVLQNQLILGSFLAIPSRLAFLALVAVFRSLETDQSGDMHRTSVDIVRGSEESRAVLLHAVGLIQKVFLDDGIQSTIEDACLSEPDTRLLGMNRLVELFVELIETTAQNESERQKADLERLSNLLLSLPDRAAAAFCGNIPYDFQISVE